MQIGVNYPWIDYGWDFGDPPPAWVAADRVEGWKDSRRKQVAADFGLFASEGLFAVRWFLTGDGLNYGMGAEAPRQTGGTWTFDPLPEGHPYYGRVLEDFLFVLRVCRDTGLRLLPVLVDFSWCKKGVVAAENPAVIKCGRADAIRDPRKREVFFDRLLAPLLACSVPYRDSIYAWELINEPEWAAAEPGRWWRRDGSGRVRREEMADFIREGARRIDSVQLPDGGRAFRSTVGFAHWESLETWDAAGLGLTLHQFHYYAQGNRGLPGCPADGDCPCIVGEFATAVERDWPDLRARGLDQNARNRLACIESRGYGACFLWSARAADRATRWTEEERRAVLSFAGPDRDGPRSA